jgi:hypothetical protein
LPEDFLLATSETAGAPKRQKSSFKRPHACRTKIQERLSRAEIGIRHHPEDACGRSCRRTLADYQRLGYYKPLDHPSR